MSHAENFDFTILGAGLAGLSLADVLADKGCKVLIVENKVAGSGASGTPIGLVNPATGRKANLSWEAEQCYTAISDTLQKVQDFNQTPFFSRTGILRPAIDDETYTHFKQSFERKDWPDNWCQWLEAGEVTRANPYLIESRGGLLLKAGLSVDVPGYLNAFVAYLKNKGIEYRDHQQYQLIRNGPNWKIQSKEYGVVNTASVVFACGHSVVDSSYWANIPLHPVKGQISKYRTRGPLNWDIPVAAYGYFARSGANEFVAGGTYEHQFDDAQYDSKGAKILEKKVRHIMPALLKASTLISQWAGIRASTPNRLPILGPHETEANLHIFSGLGSKGLLYSVFTARVLADFLNGGKQIPKALNIERLKKA